jgi:MFS family permease
MHFAPPNSDQEVAEATRKATSIGLNVLSKVFAILMLAAITVLAGYYVDQWLGWRFFIYIGSLLSVVIGIGGLLGIAKQANSALIDNTKKNKDS